MITRTTLTKQEIEKLEGIKRELVGKFRKRVTPVFKRADGTIEPIYPKPKSLWEWMISPTIGVPFGNGWNVKTPPYMKLSLQEFRKSAAQAATRIDQFRGISYNAFLQRIMDDLIASMGIPEPLGRGTVTVILPIKPEPFVPRTMTVQVKSSVKAGQLLTLKDIVP